MGLCGSSAWSSGRGPNCATARLQQRQAMMLPAARAPSGPIGGAGRDAPAVERLPRARDEPPAALARRSAPRARRVQALLEREVVDVERAGGRRQPVLPRQHDRGRPQGGGHGRNGSRPSARVPRHGGDPSPRLLQPARRPVARSSARHCPPPWPDHTGTGGGAETGVADHAVRSGKSAADGWFPQGNEPARARVRSRCNGAGSRGRLVPAQRSGGHTMRRRRRRIGIALTADKPSGPGPAD